MMFQNYIKLAWRNMAKSPFFSFVHLTGLTIGVTACLIIFTIVSYEFSFDKFHAQKERIFRIAGKSETDPSGEQAAGFVPYAVPKAIRNEVPGMENLAAFINYESAVKVPQASGEDRVFPRRDWENGAAEIVIAEGSYFEVFDYKWLAGNPDKALSSPGQVVLTRSKAEKYFGNIRPDDVLGKKLIYGDSILTTVSGLVEDLPQATDLSFTDFISYPSISALTELSYIKPDKWNDLWSASQAFVLLDEGAKEEEINRRLEHFYQVHKAAEGLFTIPFLQELNDIHFRYGDNYVRKVSKTNLWMLAGVAFILLIIAVFNFVNLSTAQASLKVKQTSLQLILGGKQSHLFMKSLVEACLYASFAVAIAAIIAPPILKSYASYLTHPVGIDYGIETWVMLLTLLVAICFSSAFIPLVFRTNGVRTNSLAGNLTSSGKGNLSYRKTMISAQFIISMSLVLASVFLHRQLSFFTQSDLGLNVKNVVSFRIPRMEDADKANLMERISVLPQVEDATFQIFDPIGQNFGMDKLIDTENGDAEMDVAYKSGSQNFIPFYQIRLLAGRNFLSEQGVDEVIVSESFARSIGVSDLSKLPGRKFEFQGNSLTCVGVVADFHQQSMQQAIQRTIITCKRGNSLALRIREGSNQAHVLSEIESRCREVFPADFAFGPGFLETNIEKFYAREQESGRLIILASVLATLVSCIGMNGLFILVLGQKLKEIALRKILGATISHLTVLMTRDLLRLMVFAFVIAVPIAWYVLNLWIQNYAYSQPIEWGLYLLAGVLMAGFAVLSVLVQCIPAALRNPSEVLKSE